MKTIEKRELMKKAPQLLRVAAYARVSSGKDAMHHSLSAQVSYYSDLIQRHTGWRYCGVYADEAKTGTKDSRGEFKRLLSDCRAGKLDMVITKSVSRFARNTVTLLETVRELKTLGVDVFFEEQNIHTLSSEGELMLSILASYAQEESLSASENQKWRIRKNFEEGLPWNSTMLGYRQKNGKLIVQPDEAEIVRRIFKEYLEGKGVVAIANELNAEGIRTRLGSEWRKNTVSRILRNYAYTGNLLLQKTYRENYITKKVLVNNGELPKYHATDTHEAIISIDDFNAVQAEITKRAAKFAPPEKSYSGRYPFSGLIVCGNCGKHYKRKVTTTGPVWICSTYSDKGKAFCPSKQIPDSTLTALMKDVDLGRVEFMTAEDGNNIRIRFADGTEEVRQWKDRSRAESWTEEMRKEAARKTAERNRKNG